jgi:hypothetical protein
LAKIILLAVSQILSIAVDSYLKGAAVLYFHFTGWGFWLAVVAVSAACGSKRDRDSDPPAVQATTERTSVQQPVQQSDPYNSNFVVTPSGSELSLVRLTPEEFANFAHAALQFRTGWTDPFGHFHEHITTNLVESLGGVDFHRAHTRDPVPKVTTILAVRNLAYDIANGVVSRDTAVDLGSESGPKKIFVHVDLRIDRPWNGTTEEGEDAGNRAAMHAKWEKQLVELHYLVYARKPEPDEIQLASEFFIDFRKVDQWPANAWTAYLFALLSSAEAWYR